MTSRTRAPLALVLASVLLAGLVGCAQSVDPIERLGKKAAQRVRTPEPDAVSYGRWGLAGPLAPPPRPPARPAVRVGRRGLPPVVDRVPTRERVVFLTYGDGAERDPRFTEMVRELRLPVTLFLTDRVAGPGYGQLARLRSAGASVENNTLDHTSLRGLPYAGQRAEICGQQEKLRQRFGVRPRLLRPPYGTYDETTLRAAADCGVDALVLWRDPHRLHPGDIIRHHPTPRLLHHIQRQGFTVARLEDYL
ncbi:polysaccharide deacetylase family protein [Streptomyces sp. NPDC008313]|uniref:polysaccharide deacetylase family protein n=1 Tax=Streptomyces sp. NPDC008313 TaxID=3364826 RepID=UPI0036F13151